MSEAICPRCHEKHDSSAQVRVFGQRFHQRCWVPWLEDALARGKEKVPCSTCGGLVYIEDSYCPDCSPEAEEARADAITPQMAAKVLRCPDGFNTLVDAFEAAEGDTAARMDEALKAVARTITQEDKQ